MRTFFALLLAALILFSGSLAEDSKGKLEKIQKELKKSKQELQKTKKEEQAVLGRLVVINKELKRTKQTLDKANKKIKVNEKQVKVLHTEVNKRARELSVEKKELKRRINEVYKSSGLNYLELLMSSRSMSDFFNRLYFFSKIVEKDAQLVDNIRTNVNQVKSKKQTLEKKTEEIKSLAKSVKVKKVEISEKATEKKKLYQALKKRRKQYEAEVAELEKNSNELESLIVKKVGSSSGTVKGTGVLVWPLRGRITSRYGYRRHPMWGGRHLHTGLDIAARYGTPIKAADSGKVILASWWGGYGKAIVVDHGKGITTVYGHLSRIYKKVGSTVIKGQTIGLVGNTGYSTGPHLHFEVRKNGKHRNPIKYLK